MVRKVLILVALVFMAAALPVLSQENNRALQAYLDRFRDATPATRLAILRSADLLTAAELGPLYVEAVRYAVANSSGIDGDDTIQQIALVAVDGIREGRHSPAVRVLWSLFATWSGTAGRVAVLTALREIDHGDAQLVIDLNAWTAAQAALAEGGSRVDEQVVRNAAITLGEFGDPSSGAVLLDVQVARISAVVTADARRAMKSLPGTYPATAVAALTSRPVLSRRDALAQVLSDPDLTGEERGSIAAGVLSHAMGEAIRDPVQLDAHRNLRYLAASTLVSHPYPQAAASLVRHFNTTFQDFDRGLTTRNWVLEAIAALGSTGTLPAAIRLAAFLDLLNTYTERDRPYDTQVVLAVVSNLARLGYGATYDPVFQVTLLGYPQQVRDAAREALRALTR